MLCVETGTVAPDATLILPREVIVKLQKRFFQENGDRVISMQRFIGNDDHFHQTLNCGHLGSCKVIMREEWAILKMRNAHKTLDIAGQAINLMMSFRDMAKGNLSNPNNLINPEILDYKLNHVVELYRQLKMEVPDNSGQLTLPEET